MVAWRSLRSEIRDGATLAVMVEATFDRGAVFPATSIAWMAT